MMVMNLLVVCLKLNFLNLFDCFLSAKLYEIVENLCTAVFNHEASVLLVDLVPHLITQWIDKNYMLATFPIILTKCATRNDFLIEYQNIITLRIIQHKLELVPQLEQMYQDSLSNILTTV